MINKEFIGNKIKLARYKKNMTQEQLAEQIGLSPNYLSKVERGLNSPSAEVLLKIIDILDLSLDDFGILKNKNIDENKHKIIDMIIECDDMAISEIEPIIKIILNLFKKLRK